MTQQDAVARIAAHLEAQGHSLGRDFAQTIAQDAWNEIKAIAREDQALVGKITVRQRDEPPDWFKQAYSSAMLSNLRT